MNKAKNGKPPAQNTRENSIGWMLKTLCAQLDREMKQELKQIDMDLNRFAVLMTLLEKEGLTQTELGAQIKMPGYATTRTLDALEKKGLVERRADERSRRSYRIFLTKDGRSLGPSLFSIVGEVNKELLSTVSDEEQQQLKDILQKLVLRG
ncbi:MAG: MarR family transcriptional regulator [Pseudomonadales bacterium]|nr:MarR family transcriptional regulator [Pseudomonadales bacterium]